MPPWCESILGLKVEAVQGKQVSLEWTETSGGLWEWLHDPGVPLSFPVESTASLDATEHWECGTILEFISHFLWRAPPLGIRRERREFFPDHAGKGSLLSSYEAETVRLWMWAGLPCFVSSGDGYVGELLELQQWWEGPFGSSRC